eukprot:258010-Pyramimonas_sp.AAC.1
MTSFRRLCRAKPRQKQGSRSRSRPPLCRRCAFQRLLVGRETCAHLWLWGPGSPLCLSRPRQLETSKISGVLPARREFVMMCRRRWGA